MSASSGWGCLTSAGVAGIIIGLAAQKSIANLLAGFQIAFTQPIRLDDVVIVEGEWGRIEEITLTYVVVRIWDQRRLVVPLQYFNEKSFQNWTRTTSELLGTVFIYTDYTMPVEALREELSRLLETNPKWDKRVGIIQVTDTTETTMQIRALMSARNAGDTFDLRCHVREGLITFIQQQFPEALPKTRVEMQSKEQHQNGEPKEVKTSGKSGKKESEVRGN
jgi:small-conductance mechanosensitive channel